MKLTVLGCGGAPGVPSIEWGWGHCDPRNPRNRRRRPSVLVESEHAKILVDTSPDLRDQLIDTNVRSLSGVIFTHAHADHVHGIDDLRSINRAMNDAIPAYGDAVTLGEIKKRFGYVFEPLAYDAKVYYKPTLVENVVEDGKPFSIGDVDIIPFEQDHGYCTSLGLRFGSIAYTTDLVEMSEAAFDILASVDTWIVDVFTYKNHPTHAHLDKVLGWVERIKPRRTILTHMSARMDYDELVAQLPDGIEPAYDGMVLNAE